QTAGIGGIFKGIVELFKGIGRAGKKGPTPTRAQVLLKKFDTIKNKGAWRDCLMLKSTTIGGGYLHFDPPGGYTPVHNVDGSRPYLYIYENEDNRPSGKLLFLWLSEQYSNSLSGGIRYWAHTDKKFH